ncbi:MAG TPA: hypothetical protein VF749_02060 [Candidatus Acidoferrum sp.]
MPQDSVGHSVTPAEQQRAAGTALSVKTKLARVLGGQPRSLPTSPMA